MAAVDGAPGLSQGLEKQSLLRRLGEGMSAKVEVFVHLVWGTSGRQPHITTELEPALHEAIQTKCVDLRCAPNAIGSVADHVHVLAALHPLVPIARLVAEIKG